MRREQPGYGRESTWWKQNKIKQKKTTQYNHWGLILGSRLARWEGQCSGERAEAGWEVWEGSWGPFISFKGLVNILTAIRSHQMILGMYDGLNGDVPLRLWRLNTWSLGSGTVWEAQEVWPFYRKHFIGTELQELKILPIYTLLTLLPAGGLRFESSAFGFQVQQPWLLSAVPAITDPSPLELWGQNTLSISFFGRGVLITSTEK